MVQRFHDLHLTSRQALGTHVVCLEAVALSRSTVHPSNAQECADMGLPFGHWL